MTFPLSKLKARVKLGVLRFDVENASSGYADFINEALRELQDKRSFTCMRMKADVTILQGQTSVSLPANFKELQPKNSSGSPIDFILNDPDNPGSVFPVDVTFESQEIRRLWILGGMVAVWFGSMRVFLKKDSTGMIIGTEIPAVEDLHFRVNYYGYLPDLVNDTDTNPISESYPEMVIAKAKSLALASINDPASDALETFSNRKFMEASIKEARADLVGRDLRM